MSIKDKTAISFNITNHNLKDLETLMKDFDMKNENEVINTAISFFSFARDKIKNGYDLTITDESGNTKAIQNELLENLKNKVK